VLGVQSNATVWLEPEPEEVPSPANVCCRLASVALLVKLMPPGALPVAAGVKVTVYFVVWPTATVTGNVIPVTEYPDPLQAAVEMVTSAVVADKLPFKVAVFPTATLPKFNVEGETARVPAWLWF